MAKNGQQPTFQRLTRNDYLSSVAPFKKPWTMIQFQRSIGLLCRIVAGVTLLDQHGSNSSLKEVILFVCQNIYGKTRFCSQDQRAQERGNEDKEQSHFRGSSFLNESQWKGTRTAFGGSSYHSFLTGD